MKLTNLNEIKTIVVHWSESGLINDELGSDENGDIEKEIEPIVFNKMIKKAAQFVEGGYDKTVLTITLEDGSTWCKECKFYLLRTDETLMNLLRV